MPNIKGDNPYKNKPIPRDKLVWAIQSTESMGDAARVLNITYNTFKKYAKMYGLFAPHDKPFHKQTKRIRKVRINDVLNGKYPMLPSLEIQKMLLTSGLKIQECEICGFNRYRPNDMTSPLILDFLDKDIHNHNFSNLRLICYNCYYLTHGFEPPKNIPRVKLGNFRRKLITAFDDD